MAATPATADNPMTPEQQLAAFVCRFDAARLPPEALRILRHIVLAVSGTALAGAAEDGIAALRTLLLERGGAPQASTLVFGDRLPAAAAAQFNGTLCRALDYCDAMAPGPHIGSALVPAAWAAAELAGGCGGTEFVAALAVGAEVASRFNLSEAQYDGFDPTGICVVFGAAAAAARVLKLDETQTLHAMALAFNRCGGSFQSHVDGSLGVRITQGWVAQAGVECAQMARLGLTGPPNFLAGHYGYAHLYGRGTLDVAALVAGLGETWQLERVVFKKYPSCGVTQGVTELALRLAARHGLSPEQVSDRLAGAEVRLPPYAHRLVGHAFKIGANPRVDAQFNAGWCVANALLRGSSQLAHFSPAMVADPALRPLVERIRVIADPALDARGHTAVDLTLTTTDGRVLHDGLDIAPGFPGAGLSDAQHLARFEDAVAYAAQVAPQTPSRARLADFLARLDGRLRSTMHANWCGCWWLDADPRPGVAGHAALQARSARAGSVSPAVRRSAGHRRAAIGPGGRAAFAAAHRACGRCKDRWGLSWQITPTALTAAPRRRVRPNAAQAGNRARSAAASTSRLKPSSNADAARACCQ
jgi:2-methylcitrate dehydratase PrpD